MLRKKHMYGVNGEIANVFSTESAVIKFDLEGTTEFALLKKGRYYHNGRLIPDNVSLSNYIRKDTKVKFSCHVLDRLQYEGNDNIYPLTYRWYAMMCWANKDFLSGDAPKSEVTISMGLFSVPGTVSIITKRHGILTMADDTTTEENILFLASKLYIHGKRFPASKKLSTVLNIYDYVFFDAIPCLPQENKDNCSWFATCVYQGKPPQVTQTWDVSNNDFQLNSLMHPAQKSSDANTDNVTQENRMNQLGQPTKFKSKLMKLMNLYTNNSRTLFSSGYGFILDILNDEYGIILGCFKSNVYQTILFHRKNAFLFQVSLAQAKLSEIFVEGDHMQFIAVGAPSNFITDWIAVQVAVATSPPENDDTRRNTKNRSKLDHLY